MPPRATPPPPDAPVTAQLGWALRQRREQMALTRETLGERLQYGLTVIRDVERGAYHAHLSHYIARWKEVFGLDAELQELWTRVHAASHAPPAVSPVSLRGKRRGAQEDVVTPGPSSASGTPSQLTGGLPAPTGDPDVHERLLWATRAPRRVDLAVVNYLLEQLNSHRRADDLLGPHHLIPLITVQLEVLDDLCRHAKTAVQAALVAAAAQYAQFLGWLYQDAGHHAAATSWYDRCVRWALEVDDGSMAATALSMQANQHLARNNPDRVVALAQAAQHDRWGASPRVRALAAQGEAYGAALLGQAILAQHKLDEIQQLLAVAAVEEEPAWVYFLTPEYSEMQAATVHRDLGRGDLAIPVYERGLAALPADARRERGIYTARLARAHHANGDTPTALTLAGQAAVLAEQTGSARTVLEMQQLRARLAQDGEDGAVLQLDRLTQAHDGAATDAGQFLS